jgi:hypothetical protein
MVRLSRAVHARARGFAGCGFAPPTLRVRVGGAGLCDIQGGQGGRLIVAKAREPCEESKKVSQLEEDAVLTLVGDFASRWKLEAVDLQAESRAWRGGVQRLL